MFVTTANFGAHHVFRSDDGGSNWLDVDRGQLPDVSHHVAIPRQSPSTVYIASDVGVFVSTDGGAAWKKT